MAFRTKRQTNYERLRNAGFLPFEAFELSKVPRKTPYMGQFVASRASLFSRAVKQGWSAERYRKHILDIYDKGQYYSESLKGRAHRSPWKLLEDKAKYPYQRKHPEYISPKVKKRIKFRDYIDITERTLAREPINMLRGDKYPKGYGKRWN